MYWKDLLLCIVIVTQNNINYALSLYFDVTITKIDTRSFVITEHVMICKQNFLEIDNKLKIKTIKLYVKVLVTKTFLEMLEKLYKVIFMIIFCYVLFWEFRNNFLRIKETKLLDSNILLSCEKNQILICELYSYI